MRNRHLPVSCDVSFTGITASVAHFRVCQLRVRLSGSLLLHVGNAFDNA